MNNLDETDVTMRREDPGAQPAGFLLADKGDESEPFAGDVLIQNHYR
jgi:hypothetical protein